MGAPHSGNADRLRQELASGWKASAQQLAVKTGLPIKDVFGALSTLIGGGEVRAIPNSRPRLYERVVKISRTFDAPYLVAGEIDERYRGYRWWVLKRRLR